MNITLNARSKIHSLSEGPFRISVTSDMTEGSHVDLEPNAIRTALDVTICPVPVVVADMSSVNYLTDRTIDFDYRTKEFVISDRSTQ